MLRKSKPVKKQSRAADQEQIRHLQGQLGAAKRTNKELEAEIAELKRTAEENSATILAQAGREDALRAKKTELESRLQILTTEFNALEAERDRLLGEVADFKDMVRRREVAIDEKGYALNNLTENIIELETQRNDAINHADDLSRAIARLERELGDERKTTESLRENLKATQARSALHRQAAATIARAYLTREDSDDSGGVEIDKVLDYIRKAGSPEDVTDTALAVTAIVAIDYDEKNQSQTKPADSNSSEKPIDISA